jgi:hypothetical protein
MPTSPTRDERRALKSDSWARRISAICGSPARAASAFGTRCRPLVPLGLEAGLGRQGHLAAAAHHAVGGAGLGLVEAHQHVAGLDQAAVLDQDLLHHPALRVLDLLAAAVHLDRPLGHHRRRQGASDDHSSATPKVPASTA